MIYLLVFFFLAWILLPYFGSAKRVFDKYDLYRKEGDRYRFGVSSREIKNIINDSDNPEVVKKLENSLMYSRLSTFSLCIFIGLFILNAYLKSIEFQYFFRSLAK